NQGNGTLMGRMGSYTGHGFDTDPFLACTCLWQLGCTRARFSALLLPPFVLWTIWWLSQPVSSVIGWLHIGQRPSCFFHSSNRWRFMALPIFFSRLSDRYRFHVGS